MATTPSVAGPEARSWSRVRRVGLVWAGAAIVAFTALALLVGIPGQPEGPLLSVALQQRVQIALLAVVALGALLAVRRPAIGGATMVLAAAALGVLAAFQYRPEAAFLTFAAFLVPGVLQMLAAWARGHRRAWLLVLTAGLAGLLALGGVAAWSAYEYAYGPTHPESTTPAPPPGPVRWLWAGAVTDAGARVTVRLREPATRVRLLVSPAADLEGARALGPAASGDGGRSWSFRVRGLAPARRHHYAAEVDGVPDRLRGTFRTMPRGAGDVLVAFAACARARSNGAVFDAIRAMRPDLYVTTGDLFYGDISRNDPDLFREQYDGALGQPAQGALARTAASAYMWDDHDYGPDGGDASSPSREAALTVYRELVPHHPLTLDRGTGPVAQAFTLGRVRMLVADLRSQRTPSGPGGTILGRAQREWLIREIRAARGRYPLVVLVSSVPWIGPARRGADGWAGYPAERREIADAVARSGVSLVMLAGDAHMVAIDDGSHSDYSASRSGGFPVAHAGALDRHGGVKGGPYSEGAVPGSGPFGTMRVRDRGGTRIEVELSGWNWRGERLMSLRVTVPAPAR